MLDGRSDIEALMHSSRMLCAGAGLTLSDDKTDRKLSCPRPYPGASLFDPPLLTLDLHASHMLAMLHRCKSPCIATALIHCADIPVFLFVKIRYFSNECMPILVARKCEVDD
jgi:hypothetical protein